MRKTILLGLLAGMTAISCKKDRVCECTEQVDGASQKYKYTVTMHDVGLRRAYNACVHTKELYKINDSTEIEVDIYCELK